MITPLRSSGAGGLMLTTMLSSLSDVRATFDGRPGTIKKQNNNFK